MYRAKHSNILEGRDYKGVASSHVHLCGIRAGIMSVSLDVYEVVYICVYVYMMCMAYLAPRDDGNPRLDGVEEKIRA
jgi:hypothetical protein